MNPIVERLIGLALRPMRGRDAHLAWNDARLAGVPDVIQLRSVAFADGSPMPLVFAGAGVGGNVSPPLHWTGLPPGTVEIMIVMEDPDAPLPRPVVHLIATGIPSSVDRIDLGALGPSGDAAFILGRGSFDRIGYAGPRPVRGHGPHRYVFQLFALGRAVAFDQAPTLDELLDASRGCVLAKGRLVGTFERR